MILIYIILSTFLVSLLSLIGITALALREKILNKVVFYLVSLSIGGLMGGAFFHLLPEAIDESEATLTLILVLIGFFLFFALEKIIHWRHCHKENCEIHTFAYMNLLGDAVHNFLDGLIIAASFIVDVSLGITSTIAIILHEIPQEFGDFGVLVFGGVSKVRALLYNFLTAITAVAGGVIGFFFLSQLEEFSVYLLGLAAGGFLYIAASDLLPEIRKENNVVKSIINFVIIFLGIFLMYLLTFLEVK